jgi:hypothetical protein
MGANTTVAIQVFSVSPDDLEGHLDRLRQERPGEGATIVDDMRFSIAWSLDLDPIDVVAAAAGVPPQRLLAFLVAPAEAAGELLTLAEGARIARYCGLGLEDEQSVQELRGMRRLAEPYLEAAALNYDEALRRARAVRREYRRRLRGEMRAS